jgi:hypothetical protein
MMFGISALIKKADLKHNPPIGPMQSDLQTQVPDCGCLLRWAAFVPLNKIPEHALVTEDLLANHAHYLHDGPKGHIRLSQTTSSRSSNKRLRTEDSDHRNDCGKHEVAEGHRRKYL